MSRGWATAVVGAQYGSEGKGAVVAAVAHQYDAHVRSGGPNAGHTFYLDGEKFVGRSIPVGWCNPVAELFIGPGAVIDFAVLSDELEKIERAGFRVRGRLMVDPRAVSVTSSQHFAEGGVHGRAHRQIGSTGEGVGLARMAKINRGAIIPIEQAPYKCLHVANMLPQFASIGVTVGDVAAELQELIADGGRVLLEGTQGHGLSLTLGDWPYVTSTDTNAAQLAADAGISPSDVKETILVARTYPIRVAGNSGPLYEETTWEQLGLEPEITTVTRKVRRVGHWDFAQVARAVKTNWPAMVVVTFMDYLFPQSSGTVNWRALSDATLEWMKSQEQLIGAPIVAVTTGPDSFCPISTFAEAER
jgi:adenylosuccinate synthase